MRTIVARVHPRATVARRAWDGNTLSVWVLEAPTNGAANAAVIRAVAQWLQVPKSTVALRSGQSGRLKLIEVAADIKLPSPDASGQ
jgi:uncharacterized protein YggU (UPF0235/DUF167 family)